LGTSVLEYAVLFTDIQRAIRKYHNPNLKITFDCASPFFGAAKGLAYFNTNIEHNKKWSYSMEKTAEKKSYANDTRKFSDAVLAEGIHKVFTDSPITDKMLLKDLCYRGQGFLGQHNKETKTSWDTLSYTLLQSHNVWMHMTAVQEANRRYEQGIIPSMLMNEKFKRVLFKDVIDQVFACSTRAESIAIIERNEKLWEQFKSGSQGMSGKKTTNTITIMESGLFELESSDAEVDDTFEDSDDEMEKALSEV
jgi:hypothetical protein